MSNLTPEYRTDKNGRIVLRHVNPGNSTSTRQGTKIPPATLKAKERPNLTSAIKLFMTALRGNFSASVASNDVSKIARALATYSDATLARVNNHPWTYRSVRTLAMGVSNKWTETTLNDYMAATTALGITDGNSISIMHTDSWSLYPELHPANNEGDYPEERLSQITALYHVTEHMEEQGLEPYDYGARSHEAESYYLYDDKLREFLLNPEVPYDRDTIVSIITTHSVYDTDRIKDMINNSAPSLSSGVL